MEQFVLQLAGYAHATGRNGLPVEDDEVEFLTGNLSYDHRLGGYLDGLHRRQLRIRAPPDAREHLLTGASIIAVDQHPQGGFLGGA